jgi:hypothetical protein
MTTNLLIDRVVEIHPEWLPDSVRDVLLSRLKKSGRVVFHAADDEPGAWQATAPSWEMVR